MCRSLGLFAGESLRKFPVFRSGIINAIFRAASLRLLVRLLKKITRLGEDRVQARMRSKIISDQLTDRLYQSLFFSRLLPGRQTVLAQGILCRPAEMPCEYGHCRPWWRGVYPGGQGSEINLFFIFLFEKVKDAENRLKMCVFAGFCQCRLCRLCRGVYPGKFGGQGSEINLFFIFSKSKRC